LWLCNQPGFDRVIVNVIDRRPKMPFVTDITIKITPVPKFPGTPQHPIRALGGILRQGTAGVGLSPEEPDK
jgi:hypothetical protein